jgi:hypothetical protein
MGEGEIFRNDGNPRDPKKDFSEKQLAAIGAIIMAFNECEGVINALAYVSLRPPPQLAHEVVTRLGLDAKVDIAKKGAEYVLGFEQPQLALIRAALDEFLLYKRYRDAIAHAQVTDNTVPMGYVIRREKAFEVLLNDAALDALYERLWTLKQDLDVISVSFDVKAAGVLILEAERIISEMKDQCPQLENEFQVMRQQCWTEMAARHTRSQSLPPIPDFPD